MFVHVCSVLIHWWAGRAKWQHSGTNSVLYMLVQCHTDVLYALLKRSIICVYVHWHIFILIYVVSYYHILHNIAQHSFKYECNMHSSMHISTLEFCVCVGWIQHCLCVFVCTHITRLCDHAYMVIYTYVCIWHWHSCIFHFAFDHFDQHYPVACVCHHFHIKGPLSHPNLRHFATWRKQGERHWDFGSSLWIRIGKAELYKIQVDLCHGTSTSLNSRIRRFMCLWKWTSLKLRGTRHGK